MEPRKKAIELVNKYRPMFYGKYSNPAKDKGKKCALIAVEEILSNHRDTIPIMYSSNELVCDTDYWNKVKAEINAL